MFQSLGEIPKTQESSTSGKIIPTGRMEPNASPQDRKVFPEFIKFKRFSLEDEKSSDTNNELLKLCLDAVIDSHRQHSDSKNNFYSLTKETNFKEQNLLPKEEISVIKDRKLI
ncbi:MAG: hypothetical protein GY861_13755 [bacterium]|nr:hypothetical protein [bacterium]